MLPLTFSYPCDKSPDLSSFLGRHGKVQAFLLLLRTIFLPSHQYFIWASLRGRTFLYGLELVFLYSILYFFCPAHVVLYFSFLLLIITHSSLFCIWLQVIVEVFGWALSLRYLFSSQCCCLILFLALALVYLSPLHLPRACYSTTYASSLFPGFGILCHIFAVIIRICNSIWSVVSYHSTTLFISLMEISKLTLSIVLNMSTVDVWPSFCPLCLMFPRTDHPRNLVL